MANFKEKWVRYSERIIQPILYLQIHRYGRLDVLYLNAGIMPATGVDWKVVFKPDISNFIHVVSTGGNVSLSDKVYLLLFSHK